MHFAELSPVEQRVLGCLIEKRWTTPEQYPLSVNALRLACNQSTNRDPVTEYSEPQVYEAAQRLSVYGLVRLASGHTSRSIKFRHLAEEGLGLDRPQLAVLAALLLRGPQTPGELKARSERMAHLESLTELERVLSELAERGYAERQARRPGQKEDRFGQLLGGDGAAAAGVADDGGTSPSGGDEPAFGSPPAQPGAPAVAPGAPAQPGPPESLPRDPAQPGQPGSLPRDPAQPGPPASLPRDPAQPGQPGSLPRDPAQPGQPGSLPRDELEARMTALEAEVAALRAQLEELLG